MKSTSAIETRTHAVSPPLIMEQSAWGLHPSGTSQKISERGARDLAQASHLAPHSCSSRVGGWVGGEGAHHGASLVHV